MFVELPGVTTLDEAETTYAGTPTVQKTNMDGPPRSSSVADFQWDPEKGKLFNLIQKVKHSIQGSRSKRPRVAPIPYRKMSNEQQRDVRLLIIDFAYAMALYGIPSDRLEHNLIAVSNYYGVTGNYFASPTG